MKEYFAKRQLAFRQYCIYFIVAALIVVLTACGSGTVDSSSTQEPASAKLDKVIVGHVGAVSDVGIYIAIEKGYFKEQGIEVELSPFDSAGQMIAPLAKGQLDVAGGGISAGLFNSINSGIKVRIVADKGSTFKGFGYSALMVAKDKVDELKEPKNFKNKKVGITSLGGISTETALNKWLQQDGLSTKDVKLVEIPLSQMGVALSTGAVDAVSIVEPALTLSEEEGFGKVLLHDDEFWPDHTLGVLMYSEVFADKSDIGERFMTAYLKAIRDFDDAFVAKDEEKRTEVIDILMIHGKIDDRSMYDKMTFAGLDPNGEININSMEEDQNYFLSIGKQKKPVNLNKIVDTRFVEKALKELDR
jgi:NitT/TauT family transport system substrate-binding protein